MKALILILSIFTFQYSFSQITIYGNVTNDKGKTLTGANIFETRQEKGAPSDENGLYSMELKREDLSLRISFIGYHTQIIKIKKSELTKNFKLNIVLKKKTEEIIAVEVTASPVKKVISKDNLLILDFDFYGDSLLLLQKSPERGYFIEIKNESEEKGIRQKLPFRPKSIEYDCFGNIQILGKDSVFQLTFQENDFHLIDSYSMDDYKKLIRPCVAENTQDYVFKAIGEHGKSIIYSMYSKDTLDKAKTYEILDLDGWKVAAQYYIEIITLYNSSVTYGDNIINNGIWDGDMKKLNESPKLNQMIIFYDKILSKPLYSPVFNYKDDFILFDHTNNRIKYLNKEGEMPIEYHDSRKWIDLILYDKWTHKFVTFFKNKGLFTAHEINLKEGKLEKGIILEENAYPENLKIKNGYMYYLFKDPNDFYGNVLLKQRVLNP